MPLSKHFILHFYSGGKKNHISQKSAKHLFWNNFRLTKRFKNSSKKFSDALGDKSYASSQIPQMLTYLTNKPCLVYHPLHVPLSMLLTQCSSYCRHAPILLLPAVGYASFFQESLHNLHEKSQPRGF